jgi:hypothetical protein
MPSDAKLIAAAILLGHKMGGDSTREATEADIKGAIANVEKLEDALGAAASDRGSEFLKTRG